MNNFDSETGKTTETYIFNQPFFTLLYLCSKAVYEAKNNIYNLLRNHDLIQSLVIPIVQIHWPVITSLAHSVLRASQNTSRLLWSPSLPQLTFFSAWTLIATSNVRLIKDNTYINDSYTCNQFPSRDLPNPKISFGKNQTPIATPCHSRVVLKPLSYFYEYTCHLLICIA